MRRFTVPREMLPSKTISVTLREPLYADYREARKSYPVARSENDPNKVGYQFEELLMARCMEEIDGQPLEKFPRDMADRLWELTIPDRQYLFTLFVEMFYATKEQMTESRKRGESLLLVPAGSYAVEAEETPSGEVSCVFEIPNTGVQMEVDKKYRGVSTHGCGMEEMLFAYCVININGESVRPLKDLVSILDKWTIADVQYCANLFVTMTTIDEDQSVEAKKFAKELLLSMKGPASTKQKVTPKQSNTVTPS